MINLIEDRTHVPQENIQIDQKCQRLSTLIVDTFIPTLKFGEDRPYCKEDFLSSNRKRLDLFNQIHSSLLTDEHNFQEKNTRKNVVAPLLLLCGENVQSTEWTNPQLIQISYTILTFLKNSALKKESIRAVLICSDCEILNWCLEDLHNKLETWKNYPGAQHSLSWLLRQLTSPEISQFLPKFMPFVLRFLDDWEPRNKITALHCLDHILANSTKANLSKFGYIQVVKSALFHLLIGQRDFKTLQICYPCIFKLLEKTNNPKDNLDPSKYSDWDEFAKKLFYNIQTETQQELKLFYGQQLKELLPCLGIGTVRWMSTILEIISDFTENSRCLRHEGLEILSIVLELCEDRVKFHVDIIYQTLIRCLYDLGGDDNNSTHSGSQIDQRFSSFSRAENLYTFFFFQFFRFSPCDAISEVIIGQKNCAANMFLIFEVFFFCIKMLQ